MFNPLRLPDLIGNNIPPHVRAFWRVVCLIYLSTRDIMKFIWIVLFSVLEIIKAYKTPLFPYCPIVNHHKSRCVRLKSRMLPGGEYGNRTTLKILSRFDKWHCIERSYKKKDSPGDWLWGLNHWAPVSGVRRKTPTRTWPNWENRGCIKLETAGSPLVINSGLKWSTMVVRTHLSL